MIGRGTMADMHRTLYGLLRRERAVRRPWCWLGCVPSAVVVVLAALGSTVLADGAFEVRVRDGQLDLHAREAPLRTVVEAIAAEAGLTLRIYGAGNPSVTGDLAGVPLEAALKRLLHNNFILVLVETATGSRVQGLAVVLPAEPVKLGVDAAAVSLDAGGAGDLERVATELRAELARQLGAPAAATTAPRPRTITVDELQEVFRQRTEELMIQLRQRQ